MLLVDRERFERAPPRRVLAVSLHQHVSVYRSERDLDPDDALHPLASERSAAAIPGPARATAAARLRGACRW
jgi:hypothetical protein